MTVSLKKLKISDSFYRSTLHFPHTSFLCTTNICKVTKSKVHAEEFFCQMIVLLKYLTVRIPFLPSLFYVSVWHSTTLSSVTVLPTWLTVVIRCLYVAALICNVATLGNSLRRCWTNAVVSQEELCEC